MSDNLEQRKIDFKELIKTELIKCAKSPQYFIRKYCYIQHPIKGKILFDLYDYQDKCIDDFITKRFNIICKARQIGISTAAACYSLHLMSFQSDKKILVIATTQEKAKEIITKVNYAYENLPVWLRVKCTSNNKLSIRFENGSEIKAITVAPSASRGDAVSLLIIDEAAHIDKIEDVWTASAPTISTGGSCICISSPNGIGNWFHKQYSDAESGNITTPTEASEYTIRFNPIKLDWRVHPERNEIWRKEQDKLGKDWARQEYDADFIGSGNTVIDASLIEEYVAKCKDSNEKRGFDHNLWVWEKPDYNKRYVVSADCATGDGTDFSAFHVIDIDSCVQVAEWKGTLSTGDFGNMLVLIATEYNDAILIIERNGVGHAVIQKVIDRNYKNLFYMSKDHQVIDVQRNISKYLKEEKAMIPGFYTSSTSRPVIINKLDMYMREQELIINSKRLVEELRVFVWVNGKAQALKGYQDDLVMSLAIGLWVRDTSLKLFQEGINLTKSKLDSFRSSGDTSIHPAVYVPGFLDHDPYKMPLGNPNGNLVEGEDPDADIRWLL